MTDLFILLAAVTVLGTGAAIPCFFKSSRVTAGCLIMSVAVISTAAACFVTPVSDCAASLTEFDALYFSLLFAAAFIVSLFYRPLLGIAATVYVLWNAAFLVFLLSTGYSSAGEIGGVTVSSQDELSYQLEKVTLSPYCLLPLQKCWFRDPDAVGSAAFEKASRWFLSYAGAEMTAVTVTFPETASYPHMYFILIDAENGSPVITSDF